MRQTELLSKEKKKAVLEHWAGYENVRTLLMFTGGWTNTCPALAGSEVGFIGTSYHLLQEEDQHTGCSCSQGHQSRVKVSFFLFRPSGPGHEAAPGPLRQRSEPSHLGLFLWQYHPFSLHLPTS